MSTRKLIRAIQHFLAQTGKMPRAILKGLMGSLLRGLLSVGRRPSSKAGFVLPTTVLLLLVVTLAVGSLTFRTLSRTQEAIGARQQRVIYNAATPAIDRAKAKLEFLFDATKDTRYPGGVPRENQLLGMMLNDGRPLGGGLTVLPLYDPPTSTADPYTFPGEQRINIGDDPTDPASAGVDNAWRFRADLNNDGVISPAAEGKDGTIAYSILFRTPTDQATLSQGQTTQVIARASKLQVRTGPLSNLSDNNSPCTRPTPPEDPNAARNQAESGWFKDPIAGPSTLRKNFQVNAFVVYDDPARNTVSTLEFSQDRLINRGNKWGAWFRNDLEIYPGAPFNWNGAMHTEGNLLVGSPGNFTSYLISSPASCLFSKDNSEVTVGNYKADDLALDPTINGGRLFQGQIINGTARDDNFNGNSVFHIQASDQVATTTRNAGTYEQNGGDNVKVDNNVAAGGDKDSVTQAGKPSDYTLDPVILLTEGNSKPRNIASPTNPASTRNSAWDSRELVTKGRIYNQREEAPYVDDSYRADNRYGPKPKFRNEQGKLEPVPELGEEIVSRDILTRDVPAAGTGEGEVGLDGYWERRARSQGLRLIVGQRLELGNPFGWNFYKGAPGGFLLAEPLRPWFNCPPNATTTCNEARQRRSLYDNLAAVQATAVYHAAGDNAFADVPRACLATTVHPGTGYTLEQSATFENLRYDLTNVTTPTTPPASFPNGDSVDPNKFAIVNGDFFRGRGTNGWEYEPPNITALRSSTSPLRLAMQNLANFAGDPSGGAPSFMEDSVTPRLPDSIVHPHPSLAMWGDYSMLRRVLAKMNAGTGYDNLSPADKSTLHTAACTLGMLAFNIQSLQYYNPYNDAAPALSVTTPTVASNSASLKAPALRALRSYIGKLYNITPYNAAYNVDPANPAAIGTQYVVITPPPSVSIPGGGDADPADVIAGLEAWRDNAAAAGRPDEFNRLNSAIYMAQMIMTKEQVYKDLRYGFVTSLVTATAGSSEPNSKCKEWSASDPLFKLCSTQPHYPILYSLFPSLELTNDNIPDSHGEIAGNTRDSEDSTGLPWNYIRTINGTGINVYKPIDTRPTTAGDSALGQIALRPKPQSQWVLPNQDVATGNNPNNNRDTLVRFCDQPCIDRSTIGLPPTTADGSPGNKLIRVAFKDSALMNGRELMNVRAMDMNLGLMATTSTTFGSDFWLPKSGIIYAFREDAVGENNIVRPKGSADWTTCNSNTELQTNVGCRMSTGSTNANQSTDPPLNTDNLISPKPVDYYADPDRRPNSFRLRNGVDLRRVGDRGRGMTLVSDNPIYIQGDFNHHKTFDGVNRLEEFRAVLLDDFSNFYKTAGGADARNAIDPRFADYNQDRWRPAEILSDAITILSDNFCDGSVQDAMLTASQGSGAQVPASFSVRYGCQGNNNVTSYLNMNRPKFNPTATGGRANRWMRANRAETSSSLAFRSNDLGRSPIRIYRTGNPVLSSDSVGSNNEYTQSYYLMGEDRALNNAVDGQRVNATLVSGLVPTRPNQPNGGLHNFPRFLERWSSNRALYIAGSFIQLTFSNYATAPFDQDAFEVGATTIPGTGVGELIRYYDAPARRWGYDVGLQYAPAGPLAQRFITLQKVRSEFYDEPPADDPYIRNLCRQIPTANCS